MPPGKTPPAGWKASEPATAAGDSAGCKAGRHLEAAGTEAVNRGKQMKRTCIFVSTILLLLVSSIYADTPPGFTWVNLETDTTTMALVRHALQGAAMSAIREVGVKDGYAIVMVTSREAGLPTPDYDQWYIYNLSLKTGKSQLLVFGYGIKLLDWVGPTNNELAITYYDCWECEAATLFTTLHFTKDLGWQARWPNKTQNGNYPQPGAVALMTDVGDPYDDDDVDQVFATVPQPGNHFAVGSWFHSRNTKTGKVEDDVERYSIDPKTGNERIEKLVGQAALNWERRICTQSNLLIQPGIGQDSKACKRILSTPVNKK